MTHFIKLENNQPVGNPITEDNFRQFFRSIFTDISFPKYFTSEFVEPLGYGIYDFSTQPVLGRYEKAEEILPIQDNNGIWRQTWQIVKMNSVEVKSVDSNQENITRLQRNGYLLQTDWVVIFHTEEGTSIPTEWKSYRQALRDITSHKNFPYLADEDWPTKPV